MSYACALHYMRVLRYIYTHTRIHLRHVHIHSIYLVVDILENQDDLSFVSRQHLREAVGSADEVFGLLGAVSRGFSGVDVHTHANQSEAR